MNDVDEISNKLVKEFDIKESKVEGDYITIYDLIDINDVIKFLADKKIHIQAIYSGEETIEDYYRQLMSGGINK